MWLDLVNIDVCGVCLFLWLGCVLFGILAGVGDECVECCCCLFIMMLFWWIGVVVVIVWWLVSGWYCWGLLFVCYVVVDVCVVEVVW